MQTISDNELITSILGGQKENFGLLIDRYQDPAFRLSVSLLKDTTEAEEATHLAFIKAYENLGRFRKEARFSTWLYRIVYNVCVNHQRYEKRFSRQIEPEEVADLSPAELNDGWSYLKQEEQKKYLQQALDTLPFDEQFLIRGYYLEDLELAELVQITGLSMSNVKVKLHRCRKKLYLELERCLQNELMTLMEKY